VIQRAAQHINMPHSAALVKIET